MKNKLFILLCVWSYLGFGQTTVQEEFKLNTFLDLVKSFHPVVKQAELKTTEGEAKILKARGNFDPKLSLDQNIKEFDDKTYYNLFNTTLKIPTWYGIELKAGYDRNSGVYLNPEDNVPTDGLYAVGVSVPLLRGLLINERMASLKQAKLYLEQNTLKQKVLINDILYESTMAYFHWVNTWYKANLYSKYLENATWKLSNVIAKVESGDSPAIDTTEAKILVLNRSLDLEKAQLELQKARLKLSNYLWSDDLIPLELPETTIPDKNILEQPYSLKLNKTVLDSVNLENHPKIEFIKLSYETLNIERKLQMNNLLPKVNVQYNMLSATPDLSSSYQINSYKGGFQIEIPLFARKSRGNLKLAKTKLTHIELDLFNEKTVLKNKFESVYQAHISYVNQVTLAKQLTQDYTFLLQAEEKKFQVGESSLFLVNTREKKLLENQLKQVDINTKLMKTYAKWYKVAINMDTFSLN